MAWAPTSISVESRELAVLDEADLGGRAAHVERHHVLVAVRRGDGAGGDHARGGAGLHHVDGPGLGRGRGHHAAVGLHHVEGRGGAERVQPRFQRVHVAGDDRHDGGVHRGGAGAQVLAVLRAHVRRDGQVRRRAAPRARSRPTARSWAGFRVGVQQADRRRPRRLLAAAVARPDARLVELERLQHAALVVEPLGHLEAPATRHQRRGLLQMDVVEARADLAADLQDVAEAAA